MIVGDKSKFSGSLRSWSFRDFLLERLREELLSLIVFPSVADEDGLLCVISLKRGDNRKTRAKSRRKSLKQMVFGINEKDKEEEESKPVRKTPEFEFQNPLGEKNKQEDISTVPTHHFPHEEVNDNNNPSDSSNAQSNEIGNQSDRKPIE